MCVNAVDFPDNDVEIRHMLQMWYDLLFLLDK